MAKLWFQLNLMKPNAFPFGVRTGRIEEAAERILGIESAAEHLFPDLIRTS